MNDIYKISAAIFLSQSICYAEHIEFNLKNDDARVIYFLIKNLPENKDKYNYSLNRYAVIELIFSKYDNKSIDLKSTDAMDKYILKLIDDNKNYFNILEENIHSNNEIGINDEINKIKSKYKIEDEINIGNSSYRQVEEFLIASSILNIYNRVYKKQFLSRLEQKNLFEKMSKKFNLIKVGDDSFSQILNNHGKIETIDMRLYYEDLARGLDMVVESIIESNNFQSGDDFLNFCIDVFDLKNISKEDLKLLLLNEDKTLKQEQNK